MVPLVAAQAWQPQQPGRAVNPIYGSVVAQFVGSLLNNAYHRPDLAITRAGGLGHYLSQPGLAFQGDGTDNIAYYTLPVGYALTSSSKFTFVFIFRKQAAGTTGTIVGLGATTGGTGNTNLLIANDPAAGAGSFRLEVFDGAGNVAYDTTTSAFAGGLTDLLWHHVVACVDCTPSTGAAEMYMDGRSLGSIAVGATLSGTTTFAVPAICGRRRGGASGYYGAADVAMFTALDGKLSAGLAQDLSRNAWRLFQQRVLNIAATGAALTADAADSLSLSDSAVAISELVAVAADTLSVSDSAVATSELVAAASDSLTVSDSAVAGASLPAAAADTLTLSDSAVAGASLPAAAADTVSLSDSAVAAVQIVATAADTLTASDSAVASSVLVATASDTRALSDSAVAVLSGILADASDTLTVSDSATALMSVSAAATDTLAFTDFAYAASKFAVASDVVAFSDSAVAARPAGGGRSNLMKAWLQEWVISQYAEDAAVVAPPLVAREQSSVLVPYSPPQRPRERAADEAESSYKTQTISRWAAPMLPQRVRVDESIFRIIPVKDYVEENRLKQRRKKAEAAITAAHEYLLDFFE